MIQKILLTFLTLTLSSCAISKKTAPIEFNHKSKSITQETTVNAHNTNSDSSDFILPKSVRDEDNLIISEELDHNDKFIYHEVKIGETIEDVAAHYDQTVKEIARLNGLTYPYIIDEFQILKIHNHKVTDKPLATQGKITSIPSGSPTFIMPLNGKIISNFGSKTPLGPNKGINITSDSGSPVIASASGKVVYSNYDSTYGNLVIIKLNKSDTFTSYAHLKSTEIAPGDHVHQGEVIGYVGSSGKVSSPQLHFGIREGKTPKNPISFLK